MSNDNKRMNNLAADESKVDLSGGVDPGREYVIASQPEDPQVRDAVNVWIESTDASFGMRIGIEALAKDWHAHDIWLDIAFADGRVISFRESHTPVPTADERGYSSVRGAGPLQFRCVEPFRHWHVAFNGMAPETTAQRLAAGIDQPDATPVKVAFDIDMKMVAPPWVPGSLRAEAREALAGQQGDFMSPRYEQLFRASGSLQVGDDRIAVTANGLRIRRQGVRRLDEFCGHCWQSAVFPSGRAFGFITYPPRKDGQPAYNEGYIFDGSGELKPATAVEIPWLDRLQEHGDDVSFVLATDYERIQIEGETFINTRSVNKGSAILPTDFPIVQQAHGRYRWDGEETTGMVERSSPPSKIGDH